MFSALSQGSPLYILSLKDGIKYHTSAIDYISPIRPLFPNYTNGVTNMGSVVDIKATIDGHQKEFTNVTAASTVSTSDSFIITETKDAMIQQVNLVLQENQKHVDNKDIYEKNVFDCKEILKDLNPVYAKEAAMDTAITDLTQRVDNMQNEFGDVKNNIGKILNILTSTGNNK